MSAYSEVDARDDLVKDIVALWGSSEFSDIPLYKDGDPVPNLDEHSKVVHYDIVLGDSEQVTLGVNPVDRTYGAVEFYFGTKGVASRAASLMRAFIKDSYKASEVGRVHILIPSAGRTTQHKGWFYASLYVPFYFDSSPAAFKP